MAYKHLIHPKVDDLILALQAFRSKFGNLPVMGQSAEPSDIRLHPLRENATDCTHKPEEAVELFLEIY